MALYCMVDLHRTAFFGGGGNRQRQGQTTYIDLNLDLKDLYLGTTLQVGCDGDAPFEITCSAVRYAQAGYLP